MSASTQSVALGEHCAVELHRTLRVPDGPGEHPLPPSLGAMDLYPAEGGVVVVPMHRAEALWLDFSAPSWRPHALKVGLGAVDALSGGPFAPDRLAGDPQDYVVIPDQPWLDGINAGDGFVRQFVAVPLGEGLTVEGQFSAEDERGGITLALFAPKPGRFPTEDPHPGRGDVEVMACASPPAPMGIGAGGRLRQEIYEDEHGLDTWEPEPGATVRIELVDALAFEVLTGIATPRPVDAETYTRHGLPWFDLLDSTRHDLEAAERLRGVCSVADLEGRSDEPLPIPDAQIVRLLRIGSRA